MFEGACVSPLTGWFVPGKIAQKRTSKLPRVEFLNRRVGISKRPLRDAKKIERAIEISSIRRAAHMHIAVIGQGNAAILTTRRCFLAAVHIDGQRPGFAICFDNYVTPSSIVDSRFAFDNRGGTAPVDAKGYAACIARL